MRKNISFLSKILRLVKMKLIVPILRSPGPPEYIARASMVGLVWAMTPLVGIQMYMVFMTWLIAKKLKYSFSLPIGLAWTWVTNIFTMGPVYYIFYETGKLMTGKDHSLGYSAFQQILTPFKGDLCFLEAVKMFFNVLLKDWGFLMTVGCIPWAIFGGWFGYKITLKWIKSRDKRRENMRALRRNVTQISKSVTKNFTNEVRQIKRKAMQKHYQRKALKQELKNTKRQYRLLRKALKRKFLKKGEKNDNKGQTNI